jgi:hypothetical protein
MLSLDASAGISESVYITNWLNKRVGSSELAQVEGDLIWHVHRDAPRRDFVLRIAGSAFTAGAEQLRSWLNTVADHADHRAPLEPGHYHVTSAGVRIRER